MIGSSKIYQTQNHAGEAATTVDGSKVEDFIREKSKSRFEIKLRCCRCCIQHMIDSVKNAVPLPNFKSPILTKVIDYWTTSSAD